MVSEAQTVLSSPPAETKITFGSGSRLKVMVCETLAQPPPKVS